MIPQEIQEKINDLKRLHLEAASAVQRVDAAGEELRQIIGVHLPKGTVMGCSIDGKQVRVIVLRQTYPHIPGYNSNLDVLNLTEDRECQINLSDPDLQPKILYKP